MRRAPILEKDGPRFQWSDEAGMHVSVATAGAVRETRQVADLRELGEEVLGGGPVRYADLIRAIEAARDVAGKTAEKRFAAMKGAGIIVKDEMGFWRLASSARQAA